MKKEKVSVAIRIAEAGDAPAIAEMSRDFIESGLGWRYDPPHILRAMRRRESVVLAASGRPTYVARERPALAGFAIMDFGDERAHLVLLAVQPTQRRCGIGRRLVEWLMESALTAGMASVHLELRADNEAARRFYPRARLFRNGADAALLQRPRGGDADDPRAARPRTIAALLAPARPRVAQRKLRMDLAIAGKTALVTGASAGIGRAIAKSLAAEGVKLAVVARRRQLLETLQDEIGAKLVIIECDFMKEDAPKTIADAALAGLGSVEILINNAGGSRAFKLEASEEQWNEALTLNFTRQRQLTHKLLEQMMARKWGRIVSITGKSEPEGINGAFCAKAAMHSWSKGLSREVGKHGITVNCIPPGRIISEQILRNYSPEYRKHQSEHEIPVGEYGQPEDLANLVCFLASPRARYITGAVIRWTEV